MSRTAGRGASVSQSAATMNTPLLLASAPGMALIAGLGGCSVAVVDNAAAQEWVQSAGRGQRDFLEQFQVSPTDIHRSGLERAYGRDLIGSAHALGDTDRRPRLDQTNSRTQAK